jgi:hypothetical protein
MQRKAFTIVRTAAFEKSWQKSHKTIVKIREKPKWIGGSLKN